MGQYTGLYILDSYSAVHLYTSNVVAVQICTSMWLLYTIYMNHCGMTHSHTLRKKLSLEYHFIYVQRIYNIGTDIRFISTLISFHTVIHEIKLNEKFNKSTTRASTINSSVRNS